MDPAQVYLYIGSNMGDRESNLAQATMALSINFEISNIFGFFAILLAAINIFGGFLVTQRMLQMYKKKKKK